MFIHLHLLYHSKIMTFSRSTELIVCLLPFTHSHGIYLLYSKVQYIRTDLRSFLIHSHTSFAEQHVRIMYLDSISFSSQRKR